MCRQRSRAASRASRPTAPCRSLVGLPLCRNYSATRRKALRLSAKGSKTADALDATYTLGLSNLSLLAPTVTGAVEATGRLQGKLDALALDTVVKGDVGAPGVPRGPVTPQATFEAPRDVIETPL